MDGPGFRLLKKMGWEEGDSLGRRGDGILKPVEVEVTTGRKKGNTRGGRVWNERSCCEALFWRHDGCCR